MTSSLQHQEVRIPAIPSPPPHPLVVFFPTRLAPSRFPACIQQTHTCLAVVLPLVIPSFLRVGREEALFSV
jgi:hypothetical protein